MGQVLPLLEALLTGMRTTSVIQTEAEGGDAPPYLNQLVVGQTDMELPSFCAVIHRLEEQMGRVRPKQHGLVAMDVDVLMWDDTRHHLSDWERPYVTQLLPELATVQGIASLL